MVRRNELRAPMRELTLRSRVETLRDYHRARRQSAKPDSRGRPRPTVCDLAGVEGCCDRSEEIPMPQLRNDLESLLYRVHASTDATGDWSATLALLSERLEGQLATFARHHFASGQGAVICEFPENAVFRSAYTEYAARNPWFLSSEEYTVGRIVTGDELLTNNELIKTDFYRNLIKPQGLFHCLSGVAARRGNLVYLISVYRAPNQQGFGEREKANLTPALAHISLALENRWRLRQATDLAAVMSGIVDRHPQSSLLVNAEGCVLQSNQSVVADSLSSAGLCIDDGRTYGSYRRRPRCPARGNQGRCEGGARGRRHDASCDSVGTGWPTLRRRVDPCRRQGLLGGTGRER